MTKSITQLVQEAHENAVEHGLWEEDEAFEKTVTRIRREAIEALMEAYPNDSLTNTYYLCNVTNTPCTRCMPGPCSGRNKKPEGVPAELADVVITVFSACGHYGIDLEAAIAEKMAYNRTRPWKHQGKGV